MKDLPIVHPVSKACLDLYWIGYRWTLPSLCWDIKQYPLQWETPLIEDHERSLDDLQ